LLLPVVISVMLPYCGVRSAAGQKKSD